MGRKIKIFVGICLLLAGICYFLYPNYREWRTEQKVNTIIEGFEDNRDDAIIEAQKSSEIDVNDESEDSGSESLEEQDVQKDDMKQVIMPDLYDALEQYNQDLILSGQQILDAWSYEQSPVDVDSLNNGSSVIGYIEVPDMKVKLPLYLGASSEHLAKGAAVLTQTSMPIGGTSTNCVIAGHRGYQGSAFFQYIDKVQVGSMVYITNPWETLTYQVVATKIVYPSQVDDVMIQDGKDMVTLVSCHPYVVGGGGQRYLVFCERVTETQDTEISSEVSSEVQSEINQDENETMDSESVSTDVQSEYVRDNVDVDNTNSLQELETLLRFLAPMTIVLIVCIILFIQYARKHK